MNIDIDKITIDKLKYDNSLKKVICNLHYLKKNIIIKLENVNIIDKKDNYLLIKNNSEIKFIFSNLNDIIKKKICTSINKEQNIFDFDFNEDILKLNYINCIELDSKEIEFDSTKYDLALFVSHIEIVNKSLHCKLYFIKII